MLYVQKSPAPKEMIEEVQKIGLIKQENVLQRE